MFNKPQFEQPTQAEIDDWEYRPSGTGVAGETKFAIVVVTMLLVAFGFIVWQKITPTHRPLMASSDEQLKPFVFGQSPEERPDVLLGEPQPTLATFKPLPKQPVAPQQESVEVQPTLEEANPFLFAKNEPTPAEPSQIPKTEPVGESELNPFAMTEPVSQPTPVVERNIVQNDKSGRNLPAFNFEEPVQAATIPTSVPQVETTLPEPAPMQLAQTNPEPSPFFSPIETETVEQTPPQQGEAVEMPVQVATADLFQSVDTEQPETNKPFLPTQPVKKEKHFPQEAFLATNQIDPAPLPSDTEIQPIGSKESQSEPKLKEPIPLTLEPIELPTESATEPSPSFSPLVVPKDSQQGQLKSPPSEPGSLPSFGKIQEEPNQPAPMTIQPAERHPASFNSTPAAAPSFSPSNNRPLNPGTGQRVTAQKDLPVITPGPKPIQEAASNEQIYEVVEGDNYWSISQKNYGKARYFSALAEYNRERIPRPERMRAGMKVLIPEESVLQQRYPKLVGIQVVDDNTVQNSNDTGESGFFVDSSGQPYFRIGKGDTLTDVALKHLGRTSRWVQIYGMNQDVMPNANTLKIGTVLRLPRDASQVARAPE